MDGIVQRSPEWHALRAGHITASNAAKILAGGRAPYPWAPKWLGKVGADYLLTLLAQLATGGVIEQAQTRQMAYGNEYEDEARNYAQAELWRLFRLDLHLPVGELAFIKHPTEQLVGFSPDGIVGDKRLLEIKNPYDPARHAAAILADDWLRDQHRPQVQFGLWVLGGDIGYLCSYDRRYQTKQLHLIECPRDNEFIDCELEPKVLKFRELLMKLYDEHFPGKEVPF